MAALTKDRNTRVRAQGTNRHRTRKISNVKVWKGGIAAINATGYLVAASDAAALKVVGIFDETVDNSAGAAGDKEASYTTGIEAELDNLGGAIVQATQVAHVGDDQSVTTAAVAVNDVYVGNVTEFTTTKVWVFIDEAVNLKV
jgi:endo-beta-N-acetylglucosaminidase D